MIKNWVETKIPLNKSQKKKQLNETQTIFQYWKKMEIEAIKKAENVQVLESKIIGHCLRQKSQSIGQGDKTA